MITPHNKADAKARVNENSNGNRWPRRDWPKRCLRASSAQTSERLVLMALATECDVYGVASMLIANIMELCALSKREVKYALRSLESLGEIKAIEKKGGRGIPSRYELTPKMYLKGANHETPLAVVKECNGVHPLDPVYSRARVKTIRAGGEHTSNGNGAEHGQANDRMRSLSF